MLVYFWLSTWIFQPFSTMSRHLQAYSATVLDLESEVFFRSKALTLSQTLR